MSSSAPNAASSWSLTPALPARPETTPDDVLDLRAPALLDEGVAEMCGKIADLLEADVDSLADEIWASVTSTVPDYGNLRGAAAEDARRGLRAGTAMFVDVARRLRPISADERAIFEALGAGRARQGLPIDALGMATQQALRVGTRRLRRHVTELPVTRETITAFGLVTERLNDFVQALQQALTHGYLAHDSERADERAAVRTRVLENVFDGAVPLSPSLLAELRDVGVDLTAPHALVVATPRGDAGTAPSADFVNHLPGAVRGPTGSRPRPYVTALVPPSESGSWQPLVGQAADAAKQTDTVVFIELVERLDRLAPTYRLLRSQLEVAVATADEPGVADADELLPAWLAGCVPPDTHNAVLERIAGPLLRHRNSTKLCATLRAYWAGGGNVERTARDTGVTARTVRRRLDLVTELTGHAPSDPLASALLLIALHLADLRPIDPDSKEHRHPYVTR